MIVAQLEEFLCNIICRLRGSNANGNPREIIEMTIVHLIGDLYALKARFLTRYSSVRVSLVSAFLILTRTPVENRYTSSTRGGLLVPAPTGFARDSTYTFLALHGIVLDPLWSLLCRFDKP